MKTRIKIISGKTIAEAEKECNDFLESLQDYQYVKDIKVDTGYIHIIYQEFDYPRKNTSPEEPIKGTEDSGL